MIAKAASEGLWRAIVRGLIDGDWDEAVPALHQAGADELARFAKKNVILVRLDDALGSDLPSSFRLVAERQRDAVAATTGLLADVVAVCARTSDPWVLPKAFHHLPDMGHDIDLLVGSNSGIPNALMRDIRAVVAGSSIVSRAAGKLPLSVPGSETPVEVHRGRLGHLGEHQKLASSMLQRRVLSRDAGVRAFVPSAEDALLHQVIQRLFGHFAFRLSDVVVGVRLLRMPLDWEYIRTQLEATHLAFAMRVYIAIVARISGYFDLAEIAQITPLPRERPVGRLMNGVFSVSRGRVAIPLFIRKLTADVFDGDFRSAGRISSAPVLAIATVVQRAFGRPGQAAISRRPMP